MASSREAPRSDVRPIGDGSGGGAEALRIPTRPIERLAVDVRAPDPGDAVAPEPGQAGGMGPDPLGARGRSEAPPEGASSRSCSAQARETAIGSATVATLQAAELRRPALVPRAHREQQPGQGGGLRVLRQEPDVGERVGRSGGRA